ncbi:hypothetical protein BBJ29_004647 [Phytophthora kernoviae]|uniref:Uncharacterized protein n=1 Tax=Phytophthora kernoviae TaxID=325452 RepID=A0A3F2S471_9STRA|nr:hypothetical protein BBJ29_004647 [Phytophthora kernoviae]RLN69999.1 hypothetical protein BBP00_00000004 [Phytophthora kernoviae]
MLQIRNAIELIAMAGCDREPSPDSSLKLSNNSMEKPRGCGPNSSCQCQPSAAETREFRKRWLLLTDRERVAALRGDASQFLQTAIDLLPCPGCRNSAEALFYKLVDGAIRVPQIVSRSGLCFEKDSNFRLNESYLNSPDTSFSLFFHQEREDDCEDCGSFECGDKHHEHNDYGDDLNYTSYLFDELAFSRATNQIIVPCNIAFMSQLMSRADQEVVGDWGDRHARTIAEAQDEVLICLGMVIWDKMQNIWTQSRSEKRSEELLVHCAVSTLRRNFDVAVEALHGEEMMEQLLAEEDDETRRLEKKKEKRKEKKKKRKSASKQKQADRSESEKSQQADTKPKSKQGKARKHSGSKTVETSPSLTNSLSSQGDDDDFIYSNESGHLLEDHQCDSTCDEPCLRGNLTYDERMEWQLLSSMGWDASNQFTSSLPELDVDTDDENHGIPEDEIRFWKQNRSSLVRRRKAQRQKLQERFDQFVLRTTSLDA